MRHGGRHLNDFARGDLVRCLACGAAFLVTVIGPPACEHCTSDRLAPLFARR